MPGVGVRTEVVRMGKSRLLAEYCKEYLQYFNLARKQVENYSGAAMETTSQPKRQAGRPPGKKVTDALNLTLTEAEGERFRSLAQSMGKTLREALVALMDRWEGLR